MELKAFVLPLLCLGLTFGSPSALGADCLFKTSDDDSLRMTLGDFHDVMSQVIHGPAGQGDYGAVAKQAPELARLKDVVMKSSLPTNLAGRCSEISAKATELSKAVDQLVAASRPGDGNASIKPALDRVHRAYQDLNGSLTSLEDLLDDFHTLIRPLWHSAYPKKDVTAIKAAAPKLRIRSRLIVATAEKLAPARVEKAKKLQDATGMLDEAIAADDSPSILEALRIVHDSYEQLAEGSHSEGS
jgi:hypothetical protein